MYWSETMALLINFLFHSKLSPCIYHLSDSSHHRKLKTNSLRTDEAQRIPCTASYSNYERVYLYIQYLYICMNIHMNV
jgi:hypothetical protein